MYVLQPTGEWPISLDFTDEGKKCDGSHSKIRKGEGCHQHFGALREVINAASYNYGQQVKYQRCQEINENVRCSQGG